MAVPKSKLITLDIGTSWTKVFVVGHEKGNKLTIESSHAVPTTRGDLKISCDYLFEKENISAKENAIIFTSTLDEAKHIADEYKAIFVPDTEVRKNLGAWLTEQGYSDTAIFDAGHKLLSENYKASEVGSYLTFGIGETELENHLANRSLHPQTIPETKPEVEIDEAIIRVGFAKAAEVLPAASNILLTGSFFASQADFSRFALMVLDILPAGKVTEALVDKASFAVSWGAAITKYRELVNFEVNFVEKMGSFLSLGGAGKVSLDYGLKNVQEISVAKSEIAMIPASAEQKVQMSFLVDKEIRKVEAAGGNFGLIIDARPKPLPLVFGQSSSQTAMLRWQEAIQKVEIIK